MVIPQIIDPSVPIGKDDSENVEIEKFGEPAVPDFEIPLENPLPMTREIDTDVDTDAQLRKAEEVLTEKISD